MNFKNIILGLFILLVFFTGIGQRPYMPPSEARYIEIAREMVETGDWLTPQINGIPYFEKPPLFYWLQAFQIKNFGMGEYSGRFPTAVLSLLIGLFSYFLARVYESKPVGYWSLAIIASSFLFAAASRIVLLDMPVTAFITFCLGSYMLSFNKKFSGCTKNIFIYLTYFFSALAVLTKGLIGIAIPGLIIFIHLLLQSRLAEVLRFNFFSGLLLFLAIAAPWFVWASLNYEGYFEYFFIFEHFTRYATDSHRRYQPFWFYIPIILLGFLPWTFLMLQGLKAAFKKRKEAFTSFLLIWAIAPVAFFSLSNSKHITYILPSIPPLAIITATYLVSLLQGNNKLKSVSAALVVFGLTLLSIAALIYIRVLPESDPVHADIYRIFDPIIPFFITAGVAMLAALLLRSNYVKLAMLMVGSATTLQLADHTMAKLEYRYNKEISLKVKEALQPGEKVYCLNCYFPDVTVYLNRDITIVESLGELKYGYRYVKPIDMGSFQMMPENFINIAPFWQFQCYNPKNKMYIFMNKSAYQEMLAKPGYSCKWKIFAENKFKVVLTNKDM